MVSLWYLYGILMVFIWYLHRRKSVVKSDFQRGEKYGDLWRKTIYLANIWSCQMFYVFLHPMVYYCIILNTPNIL
jgi:cyanate permease